MAVFRKSKAKKGVRWQAVVHMRCHHLIRTFARSDDARAWAAAVENAITNASAARPFKPEDWLHEAAAEREAQAAAMILGDANPEPHRHWTLGRACRHYRETIQGRSTGGGAAKGCSRNGYLRARAGPRARRPGNRPCWVHPRRRGARRHLSHSLAAGGRAPMQPRPRPGPSEGAVSHLAPAW